MLMIDKIVTMKKYLYAILLFLLAACSGEKQSTPNPSGDTITVDSVAAIVDEPDDTIDYSVSEVERYEYNITVDEIFSEDELNKLRRVVVKHSKIFEWNNMECYYDEMCGEFPYDALSREDTIFLLSSIYKVVKHFDPNFGATSYAQFSERVKYVFGFDLDTMNCKDAFWNKEYYSNSAHSGSHNFTIDVSNLFFSEDIHIPFFEFSPGRDDSYVDDNRTKDCYMRCLPGYTKYYNTAIEENYQLKVRKYEIDELSHLNKFLIHNDETSLKWLLENHAVIIDQLFEVFNFDKDPRCDKYILDNVKKESINNIESLFASVSPYSYSLKYSNCSFSNYKPRIGLMQYMVDNCLVDCYDEKHEVMDDEYIYLMQALFDLLIDSYVHSNYGNDDERREMRERACEICAYLGYYLQKAYEKYTSYGKGAPRVWNDALKHALQEDKEKYDKRFILYVREHDYMGLDGYKEIFESGVKD